jgi:potassium-transporting ATPase KdpC subunit
MLLFRPAFMLLVLLSGLTGLVYPIVVTAVARVVFPAQASGSLLVRDGAQIGSSLIGQPFDDPRYLWGRLSATGPFPYNAGASSGSNLGPLNPALETAVTARVAALREAAGGDRRPIPVDLVTASGSGLDPHISPAAAAWQVERIARARGLSPAAVQAVVAQHTEGRQLGFLGEARVNVLAVNLALDGAAAK